EALRRSKTTGRVADSTTRKLARRGARFIWMRPAPYPPLCGAQRPEARGAKMLDETTVTSSEPTETTPEPSAATPEGTADGPRPRQRRRAASSPAGPPVTVQATEPEPAPAKKASKAAKATTKANTAK